MSEIENILNRVDLPEIVKVCQKFEDRALANVAAALTEELKATNPHIQAGERIAITCGSRGIDQFPILVKTVVDYVKFKGGIPVLIPSMGSHGGGTAEGQTAILHHYGITEEAMGAPILSSMEVVQIGVSDRGLPVYIDRNAYECDGIILLNRVKCHTAFRGSVESGLVKMTAIGLAKQKGAEMTHIFGFENMAKNIISVGKVALSTLRIICGVASIEDSFGHVAEVHVLRQEEILKEEPNLLKRANELMPRFYVDGGDALIMMKQGKEISGSGLDSNITGRYCVRGMTGGPKFNALVVLDLSDESEGNAAGMGQADFATKRFYNKIEPEKGYINALTSTAILTSKMPMILDTDKMAIQAAVKFSGKPDRTRTSVVFAVSSKAIGEIYMSRAALDSVPEQFRNKVEVCGEFMPIPFDEKGNLLLFR